jgi:hypothetical protein
MAESGDPCPGKNSRGIWWSGCVGDEASECSGIVKRSDSVFSHRNVCSYQLHVKREQRRLRLYSGSALLPLRFAQAGPEKAPYPLIRNTEYLPYTSTLIVPLCVLPQGYLI